MKLLKNALKKRLQNFMRIAISQSTTDSYDLAHFARINAAMSSALYMERYALQAKIFADKFGLLTYCTHLAGDQLGRLEKAGHEPLILEFGVHTGGTVNHLASQIMNHPIYGFDVFTGLPENWRDGFDQGCFALDALPKVRSNVKLVPGLFSESLPKFVEEHALGQIALLHVDCDLYSSTCDILNALGSRIGVGSIICFDEYWNYPGWKQHEFKAWREWSLRSRVVYEYVGLVPSHQQVAMRIVEAP